MIQDVFGLAWIKILHREHKMRKRDNMSKPLNTYFCVLNFKHENVR